MKKKMFFVFAAIFIFTIIWIALYIQSKCRAELIGDDTLYFDGYTYHNVNYREIGEYTETNHLIGKTAFFGGWSVYEIKEYPDYEYVVVRSAKDAEIYKKD